MTTEKVSITLDANVLAEARQVAGDRGLSAFVNDVLQRHLQSARILAFLREQDEEFGPVPAELLEEARREWETWDREWAQEQKGGSSSTMAP